MAKVYTVLAVSLKDVQSAPTECSQSETKYVKQVNNRESSRTMGRCTQSSPKTALISNLNVNRVQH